MKEVAREYTMSNADLCMLASNFIVFMTRDATEFAARAVDALAITAFETLGNAFEVFPPDEYYLAAVSGEVDLKNAARSNATEDIQLITGFFEQKWGVGDFHYKQLRIKGFHIAKDNNFLVTCRNVVTVATEYLTELTAIGLTQADIDALEAEAQTFEDKMNAVAQKKAERDEKTAERTEKGNELYSYAKKYSIIGKLIWENIDEAKYNDYIIYQTEHHGLSKPQNVAADYDPLEPLVVTLTWDLVAEATSYDVFYDIAETGAPAGDFEFLNNYPTSPIVIQAVFQKRNYFKLKAKNDEGTSSYSDEAWVDVPAGPA
jgi:uncharacterized protein YutD